MQRFTNHLVSTQREQAPRTVANNAGGFSFAVDCWTRLERFLILGTEGGTYYADERKLTRDSAKAVERCLAADGIKTVDTIVAVSNNGRAPKNDAALFALALAAKVAEDPKTRAYAMTHGLKNVARTGTHLFHFAEYIKGLGGWGRATKRGIAEWYQVRSAKALANQVTKYRSRDGWSHRDLMRKAHPVANTEDQNAVFEYAVKGTIAGEEVYFGQPEPESDALKQIWAVEQLKHADLKTVVDLVREFKLPREVVPTEHLNSPEVWEALLPHMGLTAMIRNLGKLTSIGLLSPLSGWSLAVSRRLCDIEELKAARIHPISALVALKTYSQGKGDKGSLTWTPNDRIVEALGQSFYGSFQTIEPSGKRTLLGIDVSGSMDHPLSGLANISCRAAAIAMAMVSLRTEEQVHTMAFSDTFMKLDLRRTDSLETAMNKANHLPFRYTDCAMPMLWAQKNKVPVDVFTIFTDNEVNGSSVQPSRALRDYRQAMGIPAKLVVVGMATNEFTIADPNDSGMMDVCGFDTAAPAVMADFAR